MLTKIVLFVLICASFSSWSRTNIDQVKFTFLSATDSSQFLSTKDEYIENLSVLDLSLYHSTKETISILEHLEFLKSTSLEWSDSEKQSLNQKIEIFQKTVQKLGLNLEFPNEVKFIKTNGLDAFNSHYTRGNAIIFPAVNNSITTDLATFYHEMFHIYSRFHPELSDDLFSLCGFKRIPRLQISSDLEKIRTTNPDAFYYDHSVIVKNKDSEYEVVPVMYSAIKQDEINGTVDEAAVYRLGLFDIKTFDLPNRTMFKVAETNYKDVVKANTHYYIHPEEILAENFKLLLLQNTQDVDPPSIKFQDVIDNLKSLLKR